MLSRSEMVDSGELISLKTSFGAFHEKIKICAQWNVNRIGWGLQKKGGRFWRKYME